MPRYARIHYVSLRSSLVNLPISIYGPLLERGVRPQGLAVHLTIAERKVEAYVGWTGMASASSLVHFNASSAVEKGMETIEIDPQFAQGLGFNMNDIVEIGLLHDLGFAKSVGAEPLTSDDWEILEIHASHVESNLLSQVRVANIGQEIDVWVLGRTRVRLRVASLDPSDKGKALLLTTSTEVSIAPKTRTKKTTVGQNQTTAEVPIVTAASQSKKNVQILRTLPFRLYPFIKLPSRSDQTLVFVPSPIFYKLTGRTEQKDLNQSLHFVIHRAEIRRLRSPVDPNAPSTGSGYISPPSSKILNSQTKDDEKSTEENYVLMVCSRQIPDKHILISNPINEVEEFDLVRVIVDPSDKVEVLTDELNGEPSQTLLTSQTNLAGLDEILKQCTSFCIRTFIIHSSSISVHGVSAMLVVGRSGCGKTSIAKRVAKSLEEDSNVHACTLYVDLARYTEKPIAKIQQLFKYWLDKAFWHQPSVLIFDNIDKLMGVEVEHADSFRTRHITETFIRMYSASARPAASNMRGIIMIGTAQSQSTIHPLLRTLHLFDEVVHVLPPNKDARRDILATFVASRLDTSDILKHEDLNFTALATQTEGYAAMDLEDLVARAVHQAAIRASQVSPFEDARPVLSSADFASAQADFVPLSLRDVKLQKSGVTWTDIGGLHDTRRVLRETLEWPTKYGPIFAQSPLRLRSGLLLYGFPGCGKTLLASAVAKECGLNFISVKGPEILNKYIGASEKSVRDLFERATAAKPCVLFFDEFESIAPKRGHDSTGVTDRVVNQMLTQMDGAEGLEGVYVLAATSRPDLIDSALLRPGRLDKALLCDMPNLQDRNEILESVSRKVSMSSDIDLAAIAKATDGYTGADLQALVYNANLEAVHDVMSLDLSTRTSSLAEEEDTKVEYVVVGGGEQEESGGKRKVISRAEEVALQRRWKQILSSDSKSRSKIGDTVNNISAKPIKPMILNEHIQKVLNTTRPSVSPQEIRRLRSIYREFDSDRSGELPVPPNSGGVGNRVSLM